MDDHAESYLDPVKLLYTDLSENSSVLGSDRLTPKPDHCDLLLDAVDAQLDQLKVQPPKYDFSVPREPNCCSAATLRWSQSLSKDTGIGSTTQTNETNDTPMSCLDFMHTPKMEQISEKTAGCWKGPITHRESKTRLDRSTNDKEETESWKEQVMWRLERLLGDACKERQITEETQPPSESICTEDFVRRFREEMVELTLPDGMQTLDKEEKAKMIEISDSVTCVSDLNGSSIERRESATAWGSWKGAVMVHSSQSGNPGHRKQQRTSMSKKSGVCMSPESQEAGAEERGKTAQRPEDGGKVSHRSKIETNSENLLHYQSSHPKAEGVAGVPALGFDTVSLDNDLDTICSEQVRQHIHERTGWCSVVQSVTDLNGRCSSSRHEYSESDDKDTDEDENQGRGRPRLVRIPKKMQSDLTRMEDRLFDLQQLEMRQVQQLTAETTQMEKEKNSLESVLRDSRAEKDSDSCHLQKLQRQRESCLLKVRHIEEDLAALLQRKQEDGSCINTSRVIESVLEREELERQLDCAKGKLFAEQRRAREKNEFLQEKLEETRDELHRSTEVESSLRNRCVCLEKKQIQKSEQIEALELQVSKLQLELGECRIRMGVLDKMLAHKEQQLLDLQETCGTLQTERDELKRALQHLKTQKHREPRAAQQQTHTMMINKQAEEDRVNALKEETMSLTQHIESLKDSIQLKEEEVMNLRKFLQQEREMAEKREEELHAMALEKRSQRRAQQLERDVRLAVEESGRLRAMLEEREGSHKLFTAEMEQQLRHWARQLEAECRHLHVLVEQRAEELPQSLTVVEAFTRLQTLREQLEHYVRHLHQELDSQKQAKEQLRKDQERELGIQRQLLRMERDQALNFLKERLIQEHIEELSSLKRAHMSDGGAEGGGVAASLRRQLKAKDLELRQVQRSMAQWKERTAARLAGRFKEELTAELERKAARSQEVRPEGEMKLSAKEDQTVVCSPCHGAVDAHSPSDLASFKLLHYLQSRVKQLRVENQAFAWNPPPQDIMPLNEPESCLTTITRSQDGAGILSQSSIRTF